nr:SecY-interacting protein [Motilimonas sp. E26]
MKIGNKAVALSPSLVELSDFLQRCQAYWAEQNQWPEVEFDEQWPSPCQRSGAVNGIITWQPEPNPSNVNFDNIAAALECQIHPDISAFYCQWFADSIACTFSSAEVNQYPLELIQAWNQDDFERLQENIIAHVLMQRRIKQPDTIFIASCEDEMQIISVVNETGEVILEQLGKGEIRSLAASLPEFLSRLSPA